MRAQRARLSYIYSLYWLCHLTHKDNARLDLIDQYICKSLQGLQWDPSFVGSHRWHMNKKKTHPPCEGEVGISPGAEPFLAQLAELNEADNCGVIRIHRLPGQLRVNRLVARIVLREHGLPELLQSLLVEIQLNRGH